MLQDPRYVEAKRHVEAVKGFYVHFAIFIVIMAGLVAINALTKSEWWVQWPLLGWGLGVIGHAVGVFMPVKKFGREWEERKIKERMAKMSSGAP